MTFWVYSASDGYSDLAFRYKSGAAQVTVNTQPLGGPLAGGSPGWAVRTAGCTSARASTRSW